MGDFFFWVSDLYGRLIWATLLDDFAERFLSLTKSPHQAPTKMSPIKIAQQNRPAKSPIQVAQQSRSVAFKSPIESPI